MYRGRSTVCLPICDAATSIGIELDHLGHPVERLPGDLVDGAYGVGSALEATRCGFVGRHERPAQPAHRDAGGGQPDAALAEPIHRCEGDALG